MWVSVEDVRYLFVFVFVFDIFFKKNACPDGYFKTTTTETGYQFNLLMSGKAQKPYNLGTI